MCCFKRPLVPTYHITRGAITWVAVSRNNDYSNCPDGILLGLSEKSLDLLCPQNIGTFPNSVPHSFSHLAAAGKDHETIAWSKRRR
jgi:hypothetical protein